MPNLYGEGEILNLAERISRFGHFRGATAPGYEVMYFEDGAMWRESNDRFKVCPNINEPSENRSVTSRELEDIWVGRLESEGRVQEKSEPHWMIGSEDPTDISEILGTGEPEAEKLLEIKRDYGFTQSSGDENQWRRELPFN